ncbi:MAG: OsmC family protein [Bacteroidota bacterium]
MTYHIERVAGFHFRGTNEAGHVVEMDGASEGAQAASPMQLLAMAMGACSGIDIVDILEKGRQPIASFAADVNAAREKKGTYSEFTALHVHYVLTGDLDAAKVVRAVKLSLEKYCSVSKLLEKTATITASCEVNGERHEVDLANT